MLLKLATFTAILTAGVHSFNQMDSIQGLYEKLLAKRLNTTVGKMKTEKPATRFLPSIKFIFSYVQEYGCWCFIGPEHGKGHGHPQDPYDEICKDFHQGITCAQAEIPGCHPEDGVRYQVLAGMEDNGDVVYDCNTLNADDPCAEATCFLEAYFVSGFIEKAMLGFAPDLNTYSHAMGFDNHASCVSTGGSGGAGGGGGGGGLPPGGSDGNEDASYHEVCCGTFEANTMKPIRVYDTLPKECCNKSNGGFSTYNPETSDCCDDGHVAALGAC